MGGPTDCDGGRHEEVFKDEIPADDPGEKFTEGRVGVGVGAAGDRDHRGKLGVAEAGEEAPEARDDERDGDGRAGVLRGRLSGEHEDAGADDGADAETH